MMSNFREGKLHKLLQRLLKVSYLRLLSSAIYPDKYPAGYQNAELRDKTGTSWHDSVSDTRFSKPTPHVGKNHHTFVWPESRGKSTGNVSCP